MNTGVTISPCGVRVRIRVVCTRNCAYGADYILQIMALGKPGFCIKHRVHTMGAKYVPLNSLEALLMPTRAHNSLNQRHMQAESQGASHGWDVHMIGI